MINNSKGIAVAGAHGKTTTTSMLGVALDYEGVSPSIIIGGEVDYLGSNADWAKVIIWYLRLMKVTALS